jgi:hypothetical protein
MLNNYVLGKTTDGVWFGTFCVEGNEYFVPGADYNVKINDRAINGGLYSPTPGYDIISQGTAYLYKQFAKGSLANFTYNDAASALALQKIIWWLEGEIDGWDLGPWDISGNPFVSVLLNEGGFADLDAAKVDYTGNEVRVMNLVDSNGGFHQDQLVYVPEGGWTLSLLGAGLLVVAALRRRLTSK